MNMKTTTLFALVSILLSSCAPQIYQVTQYEYTGQHPGTQANETSHEAITLRYTFWNEEGKLGFTVINHSDSPVTLDFSKSSLIVGGVNQPYITGEVISEFSGRTRIPLPFHSKTSGTSTIKLEPTLVFIAPQSEMYFQKLLLETPTVTPIRVGSYKSKAVEMTEELASFTIRHYLSYEANGQLHSTVDSFKVSSLEVMGSVPFSEINKAATLTDHVASYDPLRKNASNQYLNLGFIFFGAAGIVIASALLSGD